MNEIDRFIEAQNTSYSTALSEIKNGKKSSHWMWYIFPQVKGLGQSLWANKYGIRSKEEAQLYFHHEILGSRLVEISEALLKIEYKTARSILGETDTLKLKSSMSLFAQIQKETPIFHKVLDKYFAGEVCPQTVSFLSGSISAKDIKYT